MIIVMALGAVSLALPVLYRKIQKKRKEEMLSQALLHSLRQMVHALRIGVGLQQAIEYAAREESTPLAGEWRRLLQALQVGTSWEQALGDLARRVDLPEMKWFVAAVEIARQTGGALADVMETLADTLQERQSLRDKVQALTAQGKASGCVLAALPFLLLGVLRVVVPDLMAPMFATRTGQLLIAVIILAVSAGGLIIWKIVSIEVDA